MFSLTKHKIGVLAVLVSIFLIHTILVSNGYTGFFYERLRDIAVVVIALVLCTYYVNDVLHAEGGWPSLLIANFFILIAVIHALRLFFGGLLC